MASARASKQRNGALAANSTAAATCFSAYCKDFLAHQKSRVGQIVFSCDASAKRACRHAARPATAVACRSAKIWPTNSEWSPQSCRAAILAAIVALAWANTGVSPAYSYSRLDAFDRPAGEMTDQGFLPARQNIDAEMAGLQQGSVHARFRGDRDHAQRRIERARHERIGSHAANFAAHLRGDHRNAGDERGHDPAERCSVTAPSRPEWRCHNCHCRMIRSGVGRSKDTRPLATSSASAYFDELLVDVFRQRRQGAFIDGLDLAGVAVAISGETVRCASTRRGSI